MCWLKRDLWKACIAFAGMLLLVLIVWVPVSATGTYEGASGLASLVTVTAQATPTEDATVTALNKEKLAQEVQQLKNQNDSDLFSLLRTNLSIFLSTLVVVGGGLYGLWRWRIDRRYAQDKELQDRKAERERRDEEQQRWLEDRKAEREKRVEERFQAAVIGLGDEKEGARVGAAILLGTFLGPGYERFYPQVFQLVTANLRLPRTANPPDDPAVPRPPTALSQALITTFMEAYPLAREQEKKLGTKHADKEFEVRSTHPAPVNISSTAIHSLSARNILLDNGFLWYADLKQVWMAQASLRKADFTGADLSESNLYAVDLSEAYLWETNLSNANLWQANLCRADLRGTNMRGATLLEANLSEASLYLHVDLHRANLRKANLSGASLQEVDLESADLSEANLCGATLLYVDLSGADLSKANPEEAQSLTNTDLRGVKGLTKEQVEACKAKGAITDEDTTTISSQSIVSPSVLPQSNDGQAPSTPPRSRE